MPVRVLSMCAVLALLGCTDKDKTPETDSDTPFLDDSDVDTDADTDSDADTDTDTDSDTDTDTDTDTHTGVVHSFPNYHSAIRHSYEYYR